MALHPVSNDMPMFHYYVLPHISLVVDSAMALITCIFCEGGNP